MQYTENGLVPLKETSASSIQRVGWKHILTFAMKQGKGKELINIEPSHNLIVLLDGFYA